MDETAHPMSVPSRQISQTGRQADYHALSNGPHSTPMMPGNAHIAMSGNKETDRPLNTLIDKEVRDEKAVNIAIRRLYEGQYVITHKSVEEQEREERAVLEGIGEPAQQFAERGEDEILDGDRNADDAVLDDDAAPEDGEAAETDSGDAADAVTEDETAADAVAEEEAEAAEAAEAEAVEESDADGSAGTSEN